MQIFPSAKYILNQCNLSIFEILVPHDTCLEFRFKSICARVLTFLAQKEVTLMAESRIWQHWVGIMGVAYRILYSRALKMSDVTNENIYISGGAI